MQRFGSIPVVLAMLLVCSQGLLGSALPEERSGLPRPFRALLQVATSEFARKDAAPVLTSSALVAMTYSNGWWRIDATQALVNATPVIMSCMSIPEGIRHYVQYPGMAKPSDGRLHTLATACPIPFPPTGSEPLFVSWLAFCPRADLPILDSERMRRLVPVPHCETKVLDDPQNVGRFSASYIGPEDLFLSALSIWNNGLEVILTPSSDGLEPTFQRFRPPFARGFLEFEYKCEVTTNLDGTVFPLRSTVKRLYPIFGSPDPSAVFVRVLSRIDLLTVSPMAQEPSIGIMPIEPMVAMDFRPTNLPEQAAVQYLVTNDSWLATSDPWIQKLVAMSVTTSSEGPWPSRALLLVILGVGVVLPPCVMLFRKYKKANR